MRIWYRCPMSGHSSFPKDFLPYRSGVSIVEKIHHLVEKSLSQLKELIPEAMTEIDVNWLN